MLSKVSKTILEKHRETEDLSKGELTDYRLTGNLHNTKRASLNMSVSLETCAANGAIGSGTSIYLCFMKWVFEPLSI